MSIKGRLFDAMIATVVFAVIVFCGHILQYGIADTLKTMRSGMLVVASMGAVWFLISLFLPGHRMDRKPQTGGGKT